MAVIQQPVTEAKMCYAPQLINGIIERIDTDPAIAPKGLAQIDFYYNLVQVLRSHGEMMDVTVDREIVVPDDDPRAGSVNMQQAEIKVWDAESDGPSDETIENTSGKEHETRPEINPDPADIVPDIPPSPEGSDGTPTTT